MRRFFPFLLIVCGVSAFSFVQQNAIRPEPFLKPGNKVVYQIIFGTGEKRTSVIEMTAVQQTDGGAGIIAHETVYDEHGEMYSEYLLRYYCDSLNWYADMMNFMYRSWSGSSGETEFRSDSVVYPLKMAVGDTLPAARATITNRTGSYKSCDERELYNRVVTAYDTIETGAGMLAAYRIEQRIRLTKINAGASGKNTGETLFRCNEWFVPSIGIVKREYESVLGHNFIVLKSYTP
jgi:hypothetical protein